MGVRVSRFEMVFLLRCNSAYAHSYMLKWDIKSHFSLTAAESKETTAILTESEATYEEIELTVSSSSDKTESECDPTQESSSGAGLNGKNGKA